MSSLRVCERDARSGGPGPGPGAVAVVAPMAPGIARAEELESLLWWVVLALRGRVQDQAVALWWAPPRDVTRRCFLLLTDAHSQSMLYHESAMPYHESADDAGG